MTATTLSNTKPPRKQLSDQLDRLDSILDVLGEGLNGAVADAAREGTRLAVKDAIVEILTDPSLRARLFQASAPEPAQQPPQPARQPGFWARLKAKAGQAVAAVGRMASTVVQGAVRSVQWIATAAAEGVLALGSLGSLKKLALVGLGAGAAVGLASLLAPHAVAAVLAALSSAVAAGAVQVGIWTRRTVRALTLA